MKVGQRRPDESESSPTVPRRLHASSHPACCNKFYYNRNFHKLPDISKASVRSTTVFPPDDSRVEIHDIGSCTCLCVVSLQLARLHYQISMCDSRPELQLASSTYPLQQCASRSLSTLGGWGKFYALHSDSLGTTPTRPNDPMPGEEDFSSSECGTKMRGLCTTACEPEGGPKKRP